MKPYLQGGLLADDQRWATPIRDKLNRLARVVPNPTLLVVDGGGNLLHVDTGSAAAHASVAHPRHMPYQPLIETPIEARASLLCSPAASL